MKPKYSVKNFDYSPLPAGDDVEDMLADGADVDDLIECGVLDTGWESPQEKAEREAAEARNFAYVMAISAEARRTGNVITDF